MSALRQPEMHVIAGPNGADKSTFYEHILSPSGVEFINADLIAAELWPGQESAHAYLYDNSSIKHAYRLIAHYHNGRKVQAGTLPSWIPHELTNKN